MYQITKCRRQTICIYLPLYTLQQELRIYFLISIVEKIHISNIQIWWVTSGNNWQLFFSYTLCYQTKVKHYGFLILLFIILGVFGKGSNLKIITQTPLKALCDVAFLIICLRKHWLYSLILHQEIIYIHIYTICRLVNISMLYRIILLV